MEIPHTKKDIATSALKGIKPFRACRLEPSVSYTAFVPPKPKHGRPVPATVVIHGSLRTSELYRDAFASYAARTGSIVVVPLFPCGLTSDDDTESYKFVIRDGFRFDLALLDMVTQMREEYPHRITSEKFLLHGFSGGGQFAHRFAYLHAHQLLALSIGAPGNVTLLSDALPWWRGTRGLSALAGLPLRQDELRAIPVQLVIGEADTSEEGVVTTQLSPHWMEGINDVGRNRMALIKSLEESLLQKGVSDLTVQIVPGVGHEGFKILKPVFHFFEGVIEKANP